MGERGAWEEEEYRNKILSVCLNDLHDGFTRADKCLSHYSHSNCSNCSKQKYIYTFDFLSSLSSTNDAVLI